MTTEELRRFIADLEEKLPEDGVPEYSVGYLDALNYVLDWMEEDE